MTSPIQRATRISSRRSLFKLAPVAAGCAVLLVVSSAAYAQAADATLSTVTVTGIRKGIEDAISVKKNADSIIEAISAEDIGKLPDSSIAESIARLPGVTAQRTSGRAQQISIRGMSPDFSTGLLNGREQVSTGDSRGVEFDQYPSELVNAAVIYKTPDAGLIGQGLSGTVDLQTVRPLDFANRTISVNYRKSRLGVKSVGEGDGNKASFSYIDQFADRTIGVALGFARLKENGAVASRFESWGTGDTMYNGVKVNVPYNGFNSWIDQTTQQRDGAMAVLQFKPSKNFSSTLDLFNSKFDSIQNTKGFQAPINDSWADGKYDKGGVLSNATLSGNNVTAGTFSNVRAVLRNDLISTHDKLDSIGWNNKFVTGDWTLAGDLSTSKATSTGVNMETYSGIPQTALGTAKFDSIAFTNNQTFVPGFNYTDLSQIKITDVQGWGGGTGSPQAGYMKSPNVEDKINAVRLSAKRNLPDGWALSNVDFGFNASDRSKTREYVEGRLVVTGTDPLAAAALPAGGTAVVGGITIPTFDPESVLGNQLQRVTKLHPDIFNKDWSVKERINTLFAKSELDTNVLGLPVHGNVGVQYVGTDQSSSAYNVDRGTCSSDQVCPAATSSVGTTYTDVLPSMNLIFDAGSDQSVRVGLAKVMARPTMSDMRASSAFGVDSAKNILSGDGGNPTLKPFRATAIDVSYEKYFGKKAYIGVAGFYKDIDSYIVKITDPGFNFAPWVSASTPLPTTKSTVGSFTRPVNGQGGSISGIELSASAPLNMFTPVLDGFGVVASYSDTNSTINLATSGVTVADITTSSIPLPGLSKRVTGLTLYYEKNGFQARVNQRSRSAFVGEVLNNVGDRQLTYIAPETLVDLQISYEFQSGPAKGLSLLAQINNLTDQEFLRYRDDPSNVVESKKYGQNFLFGLNYKY
jgi:iron complex outermembrane receptor protein